MENNTPLAWSLADLSVTFTYMYLYDLCSSAEHPCLIPGHAHSKIEKLSDDRDQLSHR